MKISLVTLSFNQAEFLERCIESVAAQNGCEVEHIVVDPGSTDGSRDIIARYANHFAGVVLERDDGPADGLNRGFKLATGEILGYINADDFLLPGALATIARAFDARPHADVIVGHAVAVDAQDRPLAPLLSTRWHAAAFGFGMCNIMQQATFVRVQAFRRAGGFNVANRACWDGELLADLHLSGARFARIHQSIGAFRLHRDSITVSGRLAAQYLVDQERIQQKLFGRVPGPWESVFRSNWYRLVKYSTHPLLMARKVMHRIATAYGRPHRHQ